MEVNGRRLFINSQLLAIAGTRWNSTEACRRNQPPATSIRPNDSVVTSWAGKLVTTYLHLDRHRESFDDAELVKLQLSWLLSHNHDFIDSTKIFRSGMHRCTISETNQWASIIQLSSQLTQISLENSLGWCIEIEIDCYVAGATCVGGCAQFTWWNSFQHWNSTSVNSRECVLHSTVNLLLTEPLRSTGAFYIKFKRWLSAVGLRNVRAFYESASQFSNESTTTGNILIKVNFCFSRNGSFSTSA